MFVDMRWLVPGELDNFIRSALIEGKAPNPNPITIRTCKVIDWKVNGNGFAHLRIIGVSINSDLLPAISRFMAELGIGEDAMKITFNDAGFVGATIVVAEPEYRAKILPEVKKVRSAAGIGPV